MWQGDVSCNETHLAIVVIRSRAHHTAHIEDPPGGFYLYLAALEHPRVYTSDQPALCLCPLHRRCPLFVDHVPFHVHVGRAPLVTPYSGLLLFATHTARRSAQHRAQTGGRLSSPASGAVPQGAWGL
jgi:hypothetical protein